MARPNLSRGLICKSYRCVRPVHAKHLCHKHYVQARGQRDPSHETYTFQCWKEMWSRCVNETHERYPSHARHEVTVCDRWLRFDNFIEDMGRAPEGATIERNDPAQDYSPGNCAWVTR